MTHNFFTNSTFFHLNISSITLSIFSWHSHFIKWPFVQTQHLLKTVSQIKVSNSVTKAKISGTASTSAKGSLFDDDDDDYLFGSVESAGVSTASTKPVDIADMPFTSGLAKKIPQTKRNKTTAPGSSHAAAAAEEVVLFVHPLMVITAK